VSRCWEATYVYECDYIHYIMHLHDKHHG